MSKIELKISAGLADDTRQEVLDFINWIQTELDFKKGLVVNVTADGSPDEIDVATVPYQVQVDASSMGEWISKYGPDAAYYLLIRDLCGKLRQYFEWESLNAPLYNRDELVDGTYQLLLEYLPASKRIDLDKVSEDLDEYGTLHSTVVRVQPEAADPIRHEVYQAVRWLEENRDLFRTIDITVGQTKLADTDASLVAPEVKLPSKQEDEVKIKLLVVNYQEEAAARGTDAVLTEIIAELFLACQHYFAWLDSGLYDYDEQELEVMAEQMLEDYAQTSSRMKL